ncbi:heavy-metal-associated domain-containing protein [Pedobacter sandarakinus]|uniref:heavy-metal-associated domain-containing protein n=1 Tax=Pedobacter sandarakinus TaxID=353156 RepID=UPI002246D2D2|nr:heavy-metal-associated domain-containing protein [Pedobacter sandarakinus]MCX2573775.1 heavy-metal-associated domain-containing protein [Pedobacter sandarakinus]
MKTINIFSIIMLLFAVQVSAQQISTADLQVTGLTCSMCSNATQKSLETLGFINKVKPDLNKNLFVLTFKKGADINIDLIRKKVQDAGFSVGGLTADFTFNQVKIDDKGQAIVDGKVYRFVNAKNKTLTGTVKAAVVDKNFVSGAVFKKQAGSINSDAYASGTAMVNGKKMRVYHLVLS